jgi:NitT/TauT family transport system ATP-binding protein
MMIESPLITLKQVQKVYDNGHVALEDFNLDVRAGETLTLLGPSGCGKSTVLRLMAGLTTPSAGEVVWSSSESRKNLGVVFQEPTLLPWASVFDNVYLPLRLAGERRENAEPQVRRALERVGLSHFAAALPRQLSGGMKMRCAIARALVTVPAIILMDEPFAALDEVTRFRLNDELLSLQRELNATIVFVTHSVFESAYLSTRIVVMSRQQGAKIDEIAIDPDLLRKPEFRHSQTFADICRRASLALREAIGDQLPNDDP